MNVESHKIIIEMNWLPLCFYSLTLSFPTPLIPHPSSHTPHPTHPSSLGVVSLPSKR